MNILLVQTDIEWLSPEANYRHISAMIGDAGNTDLVVLPEMSATGFVTEPEGVAESCGERSLEWMRELSHETGAAVAGSVAAQDNGLYFNRCYFVKPDGSFEYYDKRHLFSFGGEDKHYTAGSKRTVVEWAGFRILLQVCYDLRFPVFSRNKGDYDMILYVANWPQPRRKVWDALLKARAIENVCYVAGVNRVGCDPGAAYDGGSVFIDFKGDVAASIADKREGVMRVSADMGRLRKFREKFTALADADGFELTI